MSEETKTKVSRAEIKEQIESIKNATDTIALALEQMKECGAKKSLTLTLVTLQKKVAEFGAEPKERVKMSDEEKQLLKKFREGKITVTEKENDEVPGNVATETEHKKKRR
jgi:hypothetical protein